AARFALFSQALIHQVFVAAQEFERKSIATETLPPDIGQTVVSAKMTPAGHLQELVLEKHSGSGAVDHVVIEACRKGLWTENPPPKALAADGFYRIRIEARITNFNRPTQERIWNFDTSLGIALD